ncbi:MAG: hypothetical protein M1822_007132 [Bathelium mastoideum]|nr:MAG: hypothetical protein M1822_007132 [Bathelium mastoideum]
MERHLRKIFRRPKEDRGRPQERRGSSESSSAAISHPTYDSGIPAPPSSSSFPPYQDSKWSSQGPDAQHIDSREYLSNNVGLEYQHRAPKTQQPVDANESLWQDLQRLKLRDQYQRDAGFSEWKQEDKNIGRKIEHPRTSDDAVRGRVPVGRQLRKPVAGNHAANAPNPGVHDSSSLVDKKRDSATSSASYYKDAVAPSRSTQEEENATISPHKLLRSSPNVEPTQKAQGSKLAGTGTSRQSNAQTRETSGPTQSAKRPLLVENAKSPPSLDGIVDLNDSEDTTVDTRWAPAVTHQIIHKDIHHIREERITREIHTHDHFHRILPVIDVEVLPPRHFVPSATDPTRLVEVPGSAIPGRRDDDDQKMRNWFIARTMENTQTNGSELGAGPRQFTAREFRGGEGAHYEWMGEDGVQRSTTTWIHPPTVEDGGKRTAQTVPFHLGSKNPSHDGFRPEDFSKISA